VSTLTDSRTIVTSHIDVVPPHIPYSISGNTIHGRGSNDAKGSVATQVQAVEELRAAGKLGDGDIGLLYVVGEEVNGVGMEKANDLGIKLPKTVIFGEPTELKLAVSQKVRTPPCARLILGNYHVSIGL
jgi:acetylornithine deacetylase